MHFRHAVVDAAPRVVEKDPAEHSVHVVAKLPDHVPAAQLRHSMLAPIVEAYVPAPHIVHAAVEVEAIVVDHVPVGQVAHIEAPAADEYDPAAQDRHVTEVTAPTVAEYLPLAQAAHDSADVAPV